MEKVTELQNLHAELIKRLRELERLARGGEPQLGSLTDARLRLTRASRRRTDFIEGTVFPLLHACTPEVSLAHLESLRKEIAARRVESSDHIARWRPADIERDWAGYQQASEAMRAAMKVQIRREQELVYPLLRRVSH